MRLLRLLLVAVGVLCWLLVLPAPAGAQTVTPGPFDGQSPLEPPTLSVAPTATATWTPSPTPMPTSTPEPTATATATVAPYQVSPLVAQSSSGPSDDGSRLWIGGAALLVLAGSAALLIAERRQRAK